MTLLSSVPQNMPPDAVTSPNDPNQTNSLVSGSFLSSSSSAGSSTLPSPALVNVNNLNFPLTSEPRNQEEQSQHSWPLGAIKVARGANKLVNSINSVLTPKQNRKQLTQMPIQNQQLLVSPSPKNFNESRSQSSSCNSSG